MSTMVAGLFATRSQAKRKGVAHTNGDL
jgi:hypothetical protein